MGDTVVVLDMPDEGADSDAVLGSTCEAPYSPSEGGEGPFKVVGRARDAAAASVVDSDLEGVGIRDK